MGAIEVKNVHRCFFSTIHALNGIDLKLEQQEILGIAGPNGSGKSTLLRIIAGLMLPTSGDVRVLGLSPVSNPRKVKPLIGFVPASDQCFFSRLTGSENLRLFASISGVNKKSSQKNNQSMARNPAS